MAFVIKDLVRETTASLGTGTVNLAGPVDGYVGFGDSIGNANSTYYRISSDAQWEIGIGTVTTGSPVTLSRDTVLANSLGTTAKINFAAGTKDVISALPAVALGYGAVANIVKLAGAATGNPITITADGTDANVGANVVTKGAGAFKVVQGAAENLTLDANGCLGVGVASVSSTTVLNVQRTTTTVQVGIQSGLSTGNANIALRNDSANTLLGIVVRGSAAAGTQLGVTQASAATIYGSTTALNIGTISAHSLNFGTNNAHRGSIDSAGDWIIGGASGAESIRVVPVTSAVNRLEARGATAGNHPSISAAGTDTNLHVSVGPKGTGRLNVTINGFAVGGTGVVGTRKTGWTTATGTATRTAFDTATVTLPQLAERLKALIDDLHATAGHGLIGT